MEAVLVATTHNQEETIELGLKLAGKLHGGEIIALYGNLGGGKTTFIKGLAEGLKVNENITSPTFVMLKVYNILRPKVHPGGGRKEVKLVHIDAYRCDTIEDIKSVGIEDYLNIGQNGEAVAARDDVIMVVEWAEKIREILPLRQAQGRPKNTININFEFIDENTRKITIDDSNN